MMPKFEIRYIDSSYAINIAGIAFLDSNFHTSIDMVSGTTHTADRVGHSEGSSFRCY